MRAILTTCALALLLLWPRPCPAQSQQEGPAKWKADEERCLSQCPQFPRFSGTETDEQYKQRLKQEDRTRDIPVLMVTALKDTGDIERAVTAGADDFLSKPVHRLELLTRVRSLLRVRHLQNERDRLLAYLQEVEPSFRREQLVD